MEELPHLPYDIIIDILSRLPLKSILRFKSVSKSWCRTTEDPSLADRHLSRSNEEPGLLFTVTVPNYVFPQVTNHTSLYLAKDYGSKQQLMCSAAPFLGSPHGSCNGLVCFVAYTTDLIRQVLVCNLTLQEYIVLPTDALQTMSVSDLQVFKLAYSSTTKEYKVFWYEQIPITITEARRFRQLNTPKGDQVMKIHTLGTCLWRDVLSAPPHQFCGDPVFADGGLHWRADVEHCIISLDIVKEKFYITNYPNLVSESRTRIDLFEMRGCLAVAYHFSVERVDIWVLRDENNTNTTEKQWVKEYILWIRPIAALFIVKSWGQPRIYGFNFIGLWQQDKILFECREAFDGQVIYVSWDTKTDEMVHMDLAFGGKPGTARVGVCGYTRSVVSLKPYGAL